MSQPIKTAMKNIEKQLDLLAKKLGFGCVTSYAKLWKTTINTYANKNASMWFFTISLNDAYQVCGIEINTTYFKPTPQTTKINKIATFDTPLSIEDTIKLIN